MHADGIAAYSPELKFGDEHANTVIEMMTNPVIDQMTTEMSISSSGIVSRYGTYMRLV
jgi:hypothetical protein